MNTAYLLLGSNLGDKKTFLSKAIDLLEKNTGKIIARSSLYSTEPWGVNEQDDFLNQAVCIETMFSAHQLLENILMIEEKLGRIRTKKWEARSIDIDILFFNRDVVQTHILTIPHPLLPNRKFALSPLFEIAKDFVHPVLNQSVKKLLSNCKEDLQVTQLKKESIVLNIENFIKN